MSPTLIADLENWPKRLSGFFVFRQDCTMQYLGGKSRLGKQIAYVINRIRKPGQPYWEPFCGSCWVTIHVRGAPRYCSDGCYELIEMWKALQNGWQPPRVVTEEMYAEAKAGKFGPALTAFIGFGCSFGGKWFAGYARSGCVPNYAVLAHNSTTWKIGQLENVRFFQSDYRRPAPQAECLIYADPPYAGTTGYHALDGFDTSEFWQCARNWTITGNAVIVSEYAAPLDFVCVLEMPTHTEIRTTDNGRDPRIERLFMHESQARLYYENVPEQLSF